jgi:cell division protein FtsW (lipid II flippase)
MLEDLVATAIVTGVGGLAWHASRMYARTSGQSWYWYNAILAGAVAAGITYLSVYQINMRALYHTVLTVYAAGLTLLLVEMVLEAEGVVEPPEGFESLKARLRGEVNE